MTGDQLTSLSPLVMALGAGVAWLIRRQAKKRDDAELAAKERDKAEQVERIAHAPALQEIVSKHVETLMSVQNTRIEQLIKENQDQRDQHRRDRIDWEAERKQEREEWQRQVLEWEVAKRAWEKERERFRQIIDELRAELAPYRKKVDKGES